MTNQQKTFELVSITNFVGSHLASISAILSFSVVVYLDGYFDSALDLSSAPVDINDFAFVAVELFGLAVILYGVVDVLGALVIANGFRLALAILFGLCILCGPLFATWLSGAEGSQWVNIHNMTWVMLITLLLALSIAIRKFGESSFFGGNLDIPPRSMVVVILFLGVSAVWIYGHWDFQKDAIRAQPVQIETDTGLSDAYLVRIFNSTLLVFDKAKCEMVLLSRNSVKAINRKKQSPGSLLDFRKLICLSRP